MDKIIAVVWPRPEDYPRFFQICGLEEFPPTYIEFVQHMLRRLAAEGIDPGSIEKVHVDPDEMLRRCMRNGGKIDSEARARFALFKVRSKHGQGRNAIN